MKTMFKILTAILLMICIGVICLPRVKAMEPIPPSQTPYQGPKQVTPTISQAVSLLSIPKQYKVTDLGEINKPPYYQLSKAMSINNSGKVVGYSRNDNTHSEESFFWSGVNLLTNPILGVGGLPNGNNSEALYINDFDQIVGYSIINLNQHCFLFDKGIFKDMGSFGGGDCVAFAINNSGTIVGRASMGGAFICHAFYYYNGLMHDLGTLSPNGNSVAKDINNNGVIVGSANVKYTHPTGVITDVDHAVYWKIGNAIVDLHKKCGLDSRFIGSRLDAVNNNNTAIGVVTDWGWKNSPVILKNIEDECIAEYPNFGDGFAMDINDTGLIVGHTSNNHGFVWENWVMKDLNTLIPRPTPVGSLIIREATSINNKGEIAAWAWVSTATCPACNHAILLQP